MPIRSGLSHAMSAFLAILVSAYLNAHSTILQDVTDAVGKVIVEITAVQLDSTVAGLVAITSVLTFLWGVAYHHIRHGRAQGGNGIEIIQL